MKSNPSLRSSRKLAHIKHALELTPGPGATGFADIHLIHRCLPELAWEEVDTSTSFLGLSLSAPIIINAMTGGAQDVAEINAALSRAAAATGIGLAVGSQTAALENPDLEATYRIVREENPRGVILANINAHTTPQDALRAVEMVAADLLQVHLNPAQELVMPEGERDFRGLLENIRAIVAAVPVPVIVKEVGCGIAGEDAIALAETGCKGIDIGGRGGTNFIAIEQARRQDTLGQGLVEWGIPTAVSLLEVAARLKGRDVVLIASGGINNSTAIAKSLALGARAVGIAGHFLRLLLKGGEDSLREGIMALIDELKMLLLLTGNKRPADLTNTPVVVTGLTAAWLRARGISVENLALR
ncbi:MAG: type 2 isopentenyl-diphosphate Delta-isomerase [bacterium]|mgnify:CR=1 FL=1|jgi:isopentenyl-diphosphate delta-isomerase|nr:type 2 isopentenyl-diphosphate Delta-isomerase [Bacillota bacterium]